MQELKDFFQKAMDDIDLELAVMITTGTPSGLRFVGDLIKAEFSKRGMRVRVDVDQSLETMRVCFVVTELSSGIKRRINMTADEIHQWTMGKPVHFHFSPESKTSNSRAIVNSAITSFAANKARK
jgi:hypothetical protein